MGCMEKPTLAECCFFPGCWPTWCSFDRVELNLPVIVAAALLHDVGREHDGVDPMHGLRSAEMVRVWARNGDLGLDTDLLYQVILHHCRPPDTAPMVDPPWEVRIMGDADKLDRFRLGGPIPLDETLLTLPESLALVDLAAGLNGHAFRLAR